MRTYSLFLLTMGLLAIPGVAMAECISGNPNLSGGGFSDTTYGSIGSSFVAGCDGYLRSLTLGSDTENTGVTLAIYQGEGVTGSVLLTQSGINLIYGANTIVLTNLVPVTAGSTYSWVLSHPSTIQLDSGHAYASGALILAGAVYNYAGSPDLYFYFGMVVPQTITALSASPASGAVGGT
jgi:hypothetical protein